jgi:hypothetical protein
LIVHDQEVTQAFANVLSSERYVFVKNVGVCTPADQTDFSAPLRTCMVFAEATPTTDTRSIELFNSAFNLSEIESIAEKLSLRYDLIDGPTFL